MRALPTSRTNSLPNRITEHDIDRSHISASAVTVVEQLRDAGFEAYLVGGCVRDLLIDITPKDFDVATSATPDEVRGVFRRVRLVGRRFRIAHVRMGREVIEVSTFRRAQDADEDEFPVDLADNGLGEGEDDAGAYAEADEPAAPPGAREEQELSDQGMLLRDNLYGTIDDDAFRRDFTVNALYYDPIDDTLLDYCDGMADIRARKLRLIGDAETRYREDPVRILRAVRFEAKLGFTLDAETEAAIAPMSELLTAIAPARLFDEFGKLFLSGHALAAFERMRERDLIEILLPLPPHAEPIAEAALKSTDSRLAEDKPVTAGFLLAAFLWHEYLDRCDHTGPVGNGQDNARVANAVIAEQQFTIAIPKRHALFVRDVWNLQPKLEKRSPKQVQSLLEHPRFRAAYDFLMLRVDTHDAPAELGEWWTERQKQVGEPAEADTEQQNGEASQTSPNGSRRRRRRRRRRPGRGPSSLARRHEGTAP